MSDAPDNFIIKTLKKNKSKNSVALTLIKQIQKCLYINEEY